MVAFLLLEEIELCATAEARIVAVGNAVAEQLLRRGFQRPFTRVIHSL
jgi:uroporphyrinogen-III synthase